MVLLTATHTHTSVLALHAAILDTGSADVLAGTQAVQHSAPLQVHQGVEQLFAQKLRGDLPSPSIRDTAWALTTPGSGTVPEDPP